MGLKSSKQVVKNVVDEIKAYKRSKQEIEAYNRSKQVVNDFVNNCLTCEVVGIAMQKKGYSPRDTAITMKNGGRTSTQIAQGMYSYFYSENPSKALNESDIDNTELNESDIDNKMALVFENIAYCLKFYVLMPWSNKHKIIGSALDAVGCPSGMKKDILDKVRNMKRRS